ncbi:MAG TPA: hypothetical protein VFG42_23180 [Baekduia sp.]|uniref:hypothetical protein n=1 Tax=Baekduia sp. TaxID=2600305 RepID=UPI002D7A0EB8|nr:hypothetical protein [Baekduia sp.]HET6509719.1 hypothetical protein [Baekduia sp.]
MLPTLPTLPTLRTLLVGAALAAPLAVAGSASAQDTQLLHGSVAAGGTWKLSIRHEKIGPVAGVCLDLDVQPAAAGAAGGTASGCAAGSLRVDHGLFPLVSTARAGDTPTSAVIGGIVTAKAHEIRVVFKDGKHLKLPVRSGPKRWRHVLKMDVRYFGGDLMATSTSAVASISAYDRRGHRLARTTKTR